LQERHRIWLTQNLKGHLCEKEFLFSRLHFAQGITDTRAVGGGDRGEKIISNTDATLSERLAAQKSIHKHATRCFFTAIKALHATSPQRHEPGFKNSVLGDILPKFTQYSVKSHTIAMLVLGNQNQPGKEGVSFATLHTRAYPRIGSVRGALRHHPTSY